MIVCIVRWMFWKWSDVVAVGLLCIVSVIADWMLGRIVDLCLLYLFLDSVFGLSFVCRGVVLW